MRMRSVTWPLHRGNFRVQILSIIIASPKTHILRGYKVFWRILRKNPFSFIQEPPKNENLSPIGAHHKNHLLWEQKPLKRSLNIVHAGCCPLSHHVCQFWWRSVTGFESCDGSKWIVFFCFWLFHWLALSPLQHSRTTVRVCRSSFLRSSTRLQVKPLTDVYKKYANGRRSG